MESAELCQAVRRLPEYLQARTVALFWPMPFEVNLLALLDDTHPSQGKRFVFPLTHGDRSLTWHAAGSPADMIPGRMGILEPDPARSPAVSPLEIDLVLVPGLGFTLDGGRLGFGGGFYDRFLEKLGPQIPTVAACLSCQMLSVEQLPLEAHDIPIQRVLHLS